MLKTLMALAVGVAIAGPAVAQDDFNSHAKKASAKLDEMVKLLDSIKTRQQRETAGMMGGTPVATTPARNPNSTVRRATGAGAAAGAAKKPNETAKKKPEAAPETPNKKKKP